MTLIAQTLWDLLGLADDTDKMPRAVAAPTVRNPVRVPDVVGRPRRASMSERYDALIVDMKREYQVRINRWRRSMSGCAWQVHYQNGRISRLIESPKPRGPMSCAIFLHEVGHHAIGFGTYKARCLEEYHAWRWSLETMHARGFNVTESVERRRDDALRYAVAKARRRGLRRLPIELLPWRDPRPVICP